MRNFTHIGNVDVLPLLLQIERHPELWDQNTARTDYEESPHKDVPDIWLRWRPLADLTTREAYNEKFGELMWYPGITDLPAARTILMEIMSRVGGLALGGVFISKIPPGGAVKPHTDAMSWHANYFRTKVYVTIKTNPNAINWADGESLNMAAGSVWTFDNLRPHSVYNEGDCDRITMMAAIRCD